MTSAHRPKRPVTIYCGRFGLERENLRIRPDGMLSLNPHPRALGDKLTQPNITTDFSESQIEIVTPVASSIEEALTQLNGLTQQVMRGIGRELLWPLSTPPDRLPPENQIPIADFGAGGQDKNDYRLYLSQKYGRRKQLYCGVHFNVSFDAAGDRPESANAFYLHLAAQAMRYRFFLIHLLAAGPLTVNHTAYRSVRLGVHGYRNIEPVYLDYSSARCYLSSLSTYIRKGIIESPRELYQHVRIKGSGFENPSQPPRAERIELRIPDLNPLYSCGINPDDLYLMHLYLMWASQTEDTSFDRTAQQKADTLADQAALMSVSGDLSAQINHVFAKLHIFVSRNALPDVYRSALNRTEQRWLHPERRYAERMSELLYRDYMHGGISLAEKMKNAFLNAAENPHNQGVHGHC